MHQGSLFALLADMVTENVRSCLMSEMLYADDLVLTSETMEGLTEVLETEGGIREQGAEGELREEKSGSEWGRR